MINIKNDNKKDGEKEVAKTTATTTTTTVTIRWSSLSESTSGSGGVFLATIISR